MSELGGLGYLSCKTAWKRAAREAVFQEAGSDFGQITDGSLEDWLNTPPSPD
jgi:hypothetical protein